jgi:glycosyltransferase involved in cell wall biosynthesis
MTITLVIPAHNEEEVIAQTIKSIEDKLSLDYKILVVNDHSVDNTALVVEGLMKQYSNLMLVDNDTPKGFANALKKGFSVSGSDLVIPVMADLCDDPRTIEDMYAKSLEGFDIVCGSRYMSGGTKMGGPFLQSLFSRFVGCSLKYFIGVPTFDVSNSFKCYRRNVLDSIKLESNGFEISMEITLKAYFAGFRIAETPTVWTGRSIGKSKFYLFKVAPRYIKLYLWAIFGRKR